MADPLLILPFAFPIFFVLMWLVVVTILGHLAGLPGLSAQFPDRDDPEVARFPMSSGVMGFGVSMRNVLTLTVCRSGLRVGMWKVFAPFSPPFFVPWNQLSVERAGRGLFERETLRFGSPPAGKLQISANLADRLAKAAGNRWPQPKG